METKSNNNNDFYAWANQQASIIQTGKLDSLDTQHILEELQIMSARERKELVSIPFIITFWPIALFKKIMYS